MNNFRKLKVGIIVDDKNQPYLINGLYEKSLDSKYYSIEALIIQKKDKIKKNLFRKILNLTKKKGIKRLIDRLLFKVITKIETYIVKKKILLKIYLINILFQNLKCKKYM